ncbi:hypothetical protein [Rossellomorea marisflavi]|uniref:YhfM-like domain-containing protein n=1 Tax=Rossellomorea marisflavi TaxID=189381 RepID=A0A165L622_9BACI|nr:hypothetical protein [Rossellomorea marisflavi]KZE51109.1 hypothetical protein AV649_17245 [Rossellomorea marisflavi]QHA35075.1 hypothetical protein D5E69_04125 [Rossellomorea marisflavi]
MKKILFAVSMSIILASCQKETAAPVLYDPPASNMENGLIDFKEWEGLHLSKPGVDSRINEDDALMIQAVQEVFASAVKVEGLAHLEDPDFIMEVDAANGEQQKLLLWLGDEGEESRVKKSKDSNAVYSLDEKWTDRLRQLVGNEHE